jgi:histidine triad (HIT) family protein
MSRIMATVEPLSREAQSVPKTAAMPKRPRTAHRRTAQRPARGRSVEPARGAASAGLHLCAIGAREAEASIVFQDPASLAFMDLRQMSPGHVLVIPKTHVADIFDLDDATGAALTSTVVRVARAVRDALRPDGINIWQSNGKAAGQEVFHVHFHVLPRMQGDGHAARLSAAPRHPSRAQLNAIARQIAGKIGD